jgi:predicted transcriptional regulator
MKYSYSIEEVAHWRDKKYRRSPQGIVSNERQALAFIKSVGFCLAANVDGLELPNLWDAVTGTQSFADASGVVQPLKRRYFLSYAWEIQNIIPNHNSVFYGKVFKRRPSLISREFLPYFYALTERTGTKDEYKREYSQGKLTPAAKTIMDVLMKKGSMTTKELRTTLARRSRNGAATVERALEELQRKMFITRVLGNGNHFGAIWAPITKCFPAEVRKAAKISAEEARFKLLEKYFRNQLITSVEAIHNVFGWPRQEIYQTIGKLVNAGFITATVTVDGNRGNNYCLVH